MFFINRGGGEEEKAQKALIIEILNNLFLYPRNQRGYSEDPKI